MSSPTKRTRFDSSALSPSDAVITPMAAAKESLRTSVASLQPEVTTILFRLGSEYLLFLQKTHSRQRQVKKFADDDEYIPKSARVKFTLKCSKLVEQETEYLTLVADTTTIVDTFKQDLRGKVLAVTKLEAVAFQNQSVNTFASHLRMAVKTCFACESSTRTVDVDKFVNTLLTVYHDNIVLHLEDASAEFRTVYKRIHTLSELPPPYVTELPSSTPSDNEQTIILPPAWLLQQLPRVWRIIDQVFFQPWTVYLDVVTRNDTSLALQRLNEEFFNTKVTDDTALLIDAEPPADPQLLNDIITAKVSAATKKMSIEITALKRNIATQQKNSNRDPSGASKKKLGKQKGEKKAAEKSNDSTDGKKKTKKKKKSTSTSTKSSTRRNSTSNSRRGRSNSPVRRN